MSIQEMQVPLITDTRKPIRVGVLLILVFVIGAGFWASFAPLSSAVIASGQLKVDSNRKQIQHLDGGIVRDLLIRDGQRVSQGEVLMRLDPIQAEASLAIVRSALFAARVQKARLVAERDGLATPDFSALTALGKDGPDPDLVNAQRSLFNVRQKVQSSQRDILSQQIENLGNQIEGFQAQQRAKRVQLDINREELDNLKRLQTQGLVDNSRVLDLQRVIAELEGEDGELTSSVAGTRSTIDEKRLELIRLERSFAEQVIAELQEVETQLIDLRERDVAAAQKLQHTEVVAPVDGAIVGLNIHTIGGVVSPGQLLMEIVPSDQELVIEGQLSTTDIDDVYVGQDARVKLSGLQQRTTPEVQGQVKYVSADSFVDERTGGAYYLVRVSVSETEIEKLKGQTLMPGMPAELFIQTGERTALEYLLQPLSDTLDRAWRET